MRPGRGPAATAFALAAIAALAVGCGAAQSGGAAQSATGAQPAGTAQPASMGANAQVGQVQLRDVQVTTGTPDLNRDATVRFTLVNQAGRPDALTAVGSDIAGKAEMLADASCSRSTARLVVPAGPSQQHLIRLSDLRIGLVRGGNVPITFTFANAGTVTVPTPVGSDTALPAGCAG